MSAWGQQCSSLVIRAMSAYPVIADELVWRENRRIGPMLSKKGLSLPANADSVGLTELVSGGGDDGSAGSGPGKSVLRFQP